MKRLLLLIPLLALVAAAQGYNPMSCSLYSIAGTYAVSYAGELTMAQGASSFTFWGTILGVLSIDYGGNLSGAAALGGGGYPVTDYTITGGTVEIKPDCTGTIRIKSKSNAGGPEENEVDRFVYVPDDKTLLVTIVDLGSGFTVAVNGTWKRISSMPNAANW